MKSTKIFVTGATGFIGTKLVSELVKQGHIVHALVRKTSNTESLNHKNILLFEGDILDIASIERAIQECTYVFHLAAYAKNWARNVNDFYNYNVNGMLNVFEAAKRFNVKRVVWTSTIVTFGPTAQGVIGDENMPRITNKYFTDYEASKVIAEQKAIRMTEQGFPVVIVNPTRVYGPGKLTEGNSVSLLIDQYDKGKMPFLLNGGTNIGNYVFVDDLVKGHILAMEKGRIGERYIIGGENASLKQIFDYIDEISGKKHKRINMPSKLGLAYGALQKFLADKLNIYPQITTGWVETFLLDWVYTSAKAEKELGYNYISLKDGLHLTYNWIIQQRKLRKSL